MSDDPHSRGGPPTYTMPGAVIPSHAERTRTLLAGRTDGTLSTVALDPAGYPFGSIVTFATDQAGAPLILMSTMAEHARNLAADARASLLVSESGEGAGRLAAARATLIGLVVPATDEAALETYVAAHPGAFWARFPDFGVHRLQVEAVRYVRGFGEMSWVDAGEYAAASSDPVAGGQAAVVAEVNEQRGSDLADLVAAHLDVQGAVAAVRLLSCDRYGIEVQLTLEPDTAPTEVAFGRIGFPDPLSAPEDVPAALVALAGGT